jgi:hypothetical protein
MKPPSPNARYIVEVQIFISGTKKKCETAARVIYKTYFYRFKKVVSNQSN